MKIFKQLLGMLPAILYKMPTNNSSLIRNQNSSVDLTKFLLGFDSDWAFTAGPDCPPVAAGAATREENSTVQQGPLGTEAFLE